MEDELPIQTPIVVQSVQFEGEQWSLELELPSGVSKNTALRVFLSGS